MADNGHGIMLGHYFYFLSYFNRNVFIFGSAFLAKWRKTSLRKVDDMSEGLVILGALINVLYPLLIYVTIKFNYHFPLELSIGAIAMSCDPIYYFFKNLGHGNLNYHSKVVDDLTEVFSGTIDHHFMKQWQYTIFIMDIMLASIKVIWMVVQRSEGNMACTVILSLALGLTLFGFGQEYLALYVDLSKI